MCSKRDQIALELVWREPVREDWGNGEVMMMFWKQEGKKALFIIEDAFSLETAGSPTPLDCDLFFWRMK